MADAIEESTSRRSAGREIIFPGGVDAELPEMRIFLCSEAVVDSADFTRGVPFYTCIDAIAGMS